jgi:hypothetical protein
MRQPDWKLNFWQVWMEAYHSRGIEPTPEMWEKFLDKLSSQFTGTVVDITPARVILSFNDETGEVDILGSE